MNSIDQKKEIILLENINEPNEYREGYSVIGDFDEEVVNDNGYRLIEISSTFELQIMNG